MLREIITIVGPGAGLIHLAWLASYWMARGVSWTTLVSAIVDVSLIYLTGTQAIALIKAKLSEQTTLQ